MDHAAGQLVLPSSASAAGEFVAHNAAVTCLSIGPKTGRLLATASEDRKVNLWPVGKSNCLAVSLILQSSTYLILVPDESIHMHTIVSCASNCHCLPEHLLLSASALPFTLTCEGSLYNMTQKGI